MKELISCPFCGKNVATISTVADCELCANFEEEEVCEAYEESGSCGMKFVVCAFNAGGCGASSGWHKTEQEAIDAWNNRVYVR